MKGPLGNMNLSIAKNILGKLFWFTIDIITALFVFWQINLHFYKYISKSTGTLVSVIEAAKKPFPAITVCGVFGDTDDGVGFNNTYLQDACGLE